MLTAITKPSEVRAALKRFYARLQSPKFTRHKLGMQGHTTREYKVYWHENPGLWAVLEESAGGNRSWNCFGTSNPNEAHGTIAISCEINIPHTGMNRRIAGVFARDAAGIEYVAHSARINSSRKDINKSGLIQSLGTDCVWSDVYWPDAEPMPYIVLSALSDPNLVTHIHKFVRSVERFKNSGKPADDEANGSFSPEFAGARAPYTVNAEIQANSEHGQVVNTLAAELRELAGPKILVINNRYTDIILTQGRRPLAAFEVKTSTSLIDIYTAIGQLVYRTADLRTPPAHVAVLPDDLPDDALTRLKRLGLHVCTYRWERGKPVFPNLARLIPRLLPS